MLCLTADQPAESQNPHWHDVPGPRFLTGSVHRMLRVSRDVTSAAVFQAPVRAPAQAAPAAICSAALLRELPAVDREELVYLTYT